VIQSFGIINSSLNFNRKVDDAAGATAVHLVNGVWGQLSVGLFADPPTGSKGIFLGGGSYQLVVQAISSLSLTVWAATTTIAILFVINRIIRIRLDEDDERAGCDSTQHFQGENLKQTFNEETFRGGKLNESYDRYKSFHVNRTFERSNENLY
jgi:ammonia channel protein AmtB